MFCDTQSPIFELADRHIVFGLIASPATRNHIAFDVPFCVVDAINAIASKTAKVLFEYNFIWFGATVEAVTGEQLVY